MERPELKTQDYALKLAKGAIGAIPIAGSLFGELWEMAIVPQYQKKLDEWFKYIDETLKDLIENKGVSKEDLFNDETLSALFLKSSKAYIENVEANKKHLLKAFIKSAITKPIALDKKLIFLEAIDKLNETQLLILKEVYENGLEEEGQLYKIALERKLAEKYAEGDVPYLKLLVKGLQDFHLLTYFSAEFVEDGENQWHMQVSKIGRDFFEYLNEE